MDYKPDRWVVVSIQTAEGHLYKVFGTWLGGYLHGDSWRLNSGITKVEDAGTSFKFYGHSGSCYECVKGTYGTSGYTGSVLDSFIGQADVIVMPEDTDWLVVDYGS